MSSPSPKPVATTHASLTPVGAKERIQTLDILRGFALFGILWMNIPSTWGEGGSTFQQTVAQLGVLLAMGKFRSLYAFLFGVGFSVQLLRAQARGAPIVPVYLRRLFVLLLIGLAHFVFLWDADILEGYAIMGVYLLLVRGRSLRTLLVLAALGLMFEIFFDAAVHRVGPLRRADPEVARTQELQGAVDELNLQALRQRRARTQLRGTYPEVVLDRAAQLPEGYSHFGAYFYGMDFCLFLLGLYAGRRGIFHKTAAHLPFIRKLMWWALGVGFTLNLAHVVADEVTRHYHIAWPQLVDNAVYLIGAPALCLFYASGITLLLQNERWRERLRPLSWAGRMSLTNYLLQSAIFTTIFYGYGLGLMPKASAALALTLTVLIYPLQILLSIWWMRWFRFGPMERLWRSLTYMKLQPMRVARP